MYCNTFSVVLINYDSERNYNLLISWQLFLGTNVYNVHLQDLVCKPLASKLKVKLRTLNY